jgi:magnesium-protoporphyrin IX monomethyl ester (oxidative) cyclase
VFPVVLDVDHPKFYTRLERVISNNAKLSEADESSAPAPIKVLRKLPYWVANGAEMVKLYFTPAIRSEQFQPSVR